MGLISAVLPDTGGPAWPDGTPASSQFQAEPRGDARIFSPRAATANEFNRGTPGGPGRLTFSTDLPASLVSMRPFAGVARMGILPSASRPPFGGLFFIQLGWGRHLAASFFSVHRFPSSGSVAASAM